MNKKLEELIADLSNFFICFFSRILIRKIEKKIEKLKKTQEKSEAMINTLTFVKKSLSSLIDKIEKE